MKNYLFILILSVFSLSQVNAGNDFIRISTNETDLVLRIDQKNKRLFQAYLGAKLMNESEFPSFAFASKGGSDASSPSLGWEVYPVSGTEDFFDPAFAIQHNDGNLTSVLYYVSHDVKQLESDVTQTVIISSGSKVMLCSLCKRKYNKDMDRNSSSRKETSDN